MVLENVRKDYDGAERHFRKAIELKPTALKYNNLGSLLKTVRNYDDAEWHYRKAIELDPRDAYPCWSLNLLLESQRNDIPGAIKAVEEYIRRGNPDNDGEERLATLRAKLK